MHLPPRSPHLMVIALALFNLAAEEARPVVTGITATASWFGNSFSGGDARNRGLAGGNIADAVFMQNRHEDLTVLADGTVVMNTHWDEGHHEVGLYRDGQMVGYARETGGGRGGWDVAGDDAYIYAGLAVDYTFKQRGVARYTHDGRPAPWPGAKGGNRLPITTGKTQGMACHDGELFVSDPGGKRIVVVRTEDMVIVRELGLERPGHIAVNPHDGTLWVLLQRGKEDTASTIVHLHRDGTPLPERIVDLVQAEDLAFDPVSGHLAVTENGPDQQVVFYDVRDGVRRVRTFGAKGGILGGETPGLVGDDRFYGPRGLGFDAAGNLYIGLSGATAYDGLELRSYDRDGKVRWRLYGLMFVDCASFDPADDSVVYTVDERIEIDHSKPPGEDWRLRAHIRDRFRHGTDWPGGSTAVICRIDSQRILYTMDMNGSHITVSRFDGEIAVPCAVFTSAKPWKNSPSGRAMWCDLDHDQQIDADEWTLLSSKRDCILGCPDSSGNLWIAGWGSRIRVLPCAGLDEHGSPRYHAEAEREFQAPAPFTNVDRVKYLPETDTLYLSGNTADKPRLFGEDKQFITGGRVIGRVDHFLNGTPTLRWIVDTPRYDERHDMKSFDVAGDLLFTVERQTSRVDVFDAASGVHVQQLVPGPELGPIADHVWVDIPYAIRAHQRKNGDYLLVMEDDVYGKNILWRITARRSP